MIRSISAAVVTAALAVSVAAHAGCMGGGKGSPSGALRLGASPPAAVTCKIDAIDTKDFTFACSGQTYQVYSTTVFQLGSAGTTFYDLSVGASVAVISHTIGTALVADNVSAAP